MNEVTSPVSNALVAARSALVLPVGVRRAHRLHETSSPLKPGIIQMSNHVVVCGSITSVPGVRSVHGAYSKFASPANGPSSSARL